MPKRVLCPLSALVLALTLAGPLAAFKVFSVQLAPAGRADVRSEIAVTDVVTGASRTYGNPAGTPFAPIQDTDAFPCS